MLPAPDDKPATAAEGRTFSPIWNSVGADYFATVGLPLLRGRTFTAAEATQPGGPAVAVIDDVLAKKLWPDGDALGQRIQFPVLKSASPETAGEGSGEIRRGEPIEIVGIVPASKNRLFEKEPIGALYLPFARGFQNNVFFFVRFASLSQGNESSTADLLRRTVQSIDPLLPVLELRSFEKHVDGNPQLWIVRAGAALFSIFGGLALGLAVIGIYGVKAYSVARRTREIGIRMALGAQGRTVQWMILREGFAMVAAGVAIGLLLAFATGKIVSSILFDVSSTDPFAFHDRATRAHDRRASGDLAARPEGHQNQPDGCTEDGVTGDERPEQMKIQGWSDFIRGAKAARLQFASSSHLCWL